MLLSDPVSMSYNCRAVMAANGKPLSVRYSLLPLLGRCIRITIIVKYYTSSQRAVITIFSNVLLEQSGCVFRNSVIATLLVIFFRMYTIARVHRFGIPWTRRNGFKSVCMRLIWTMLTREASNKSRASLPHTSLSRASHPRISSISTFLRLSRSPREIICTLEKS